ncbi:hypothetical protein WN944_003944 [Citrus x changshan-huyou]|uniref:Uncharacterized protein n=1 Tax=Citrus x changshan-huyou TaxID=2935761 RepID=A0AAP0LZH5_9ROSI
MKPPRMRENRAKRVRTTENEAVAVWRTKLLAVSRKPSSSAVGLAVVIVALVRRTRVVVPSLQPDIVVASMLKLFLSWDSGLISQVRCFGMSNCEAFSTALLAQPTAVQPTPTLRLTHLTADSLRRRPFASDPAAVASISAITSIPCQSISAVSSQ